MVHLPNSFFKGDILAGREFLNFSSPKPWDNGLLEQPRKNVLQGEF
jgi:hypothetical protein